MVEITGLIKLSVLSKKRHTHYLIDLKSYETDAVEFAFIKNMGEFKFGVAILFMEQGKITEKNKQVFEISTSLIHYISKMDKIAKAMI